MLQAKQSVVVAEARLESTLDRFKITLGLPTDAKVDVDQNVLGTLASLQVEEGMPAEKQLIEIALKRRFDHRTVLDEVADAGRRIVVAEDALRSSLDFSSAVNVNTEPDQPVKFEFEKIDWSAGFQLDLALDKLPERNAYRAALINLDAAIRAREQSEDQVKSDVREALRQLRSTLASYKIQTNSVKLNKRRVKQTEEFLATNYGDIRTRDLLDAKDDLVQAEIAKTQVLVNYAVARLELLRDLEALPLEPKGLRFDPGLPLPKEARMTTPPAAKPQPPEPEEERR